MEHEGQETVENLDSSQCWNLLRQVSVGRLAVCVDANRK